MSAATENPTPAHNRVPFALLVGAVVALLAISLPANGEPQTRVSAASNSASAFEQQEDTQLRDLLSLAPTTTTVPPPPPTTTTAPHRHAPRTTTAPQPAAAPQPAQGGSGDPSDPASWERLAQCEAGGNWATNTGNGYYGGLQFSLSSWRGVGGTGYPHEASKDTQIEMGKRLQASGGWGHWPACTRKFGWR